MDGILLTRAVILSDSRKILSIKLLGNSWFENIAFIAICYLLSKDERAILKL